MLYEYAKQYCQRHGAELVFYMCSSCSSSRCIFEGRCDAPSNIICQKQKSAPGAIEDSTPHYFDEEESSGWWNIWSGNKRRWTLLLLNKYIRQMTVIY